MGIITKNPKFTSGGSHLTGLDVKVNKLAIDVGQRILDEDDNAAKAAKASSAIRREFADYKSVMSPSAIETHKDKNGSDVRIISSHAFAPENVVQMRAFRSQQEVAQSLGELNARRALSKIGIDTGLYDQKGFSLEGSVFEQQGKENLEIFAHAKTVQSDIAKGRVAKSLADIRKFEAAKRSAGTEAYADSLLHQLGDPDSELNKKLKGEKSSKQKKAEIDIVAKGTERGMKKIGAGRTGSLVSMADFIAAGRLMNKAFGGFVGREMGAASYSQSLINASALTGSDPVTIAKYRFALKTFNGSDASADSLFKAINNLIQGSLVGEESPYFKLASQYGFNLTGSGTGAMLTEDEMLERLRDYFTSKERSAREKAHFAYGAGLDAAAIRLFSSSDKIYRERLGSQYVLREEEIEALAETHERFTTLMEKFSTTMSRIVGEHGVLDYWIEKGESLNALLDKWISRDTNTQQPGLLASKSISKWERFWLSDDERKQLYGTDARLRFGIPGGMFGIDKLLFDYQLGDDILNKRYRMTPDGNRIKIDLEVKDSNGDKLDAKQTSYFSADRGIEVVIV